ncbi:MAG: DUF222 domain-containing protein, partial [Gammaproteobacteria bacterium]
MGELRSAVEELAAVDLEQLDDSALGEFVVELSRQRDRIEAITQRAIREHDRRQAWRAAGACSEKLWLAQQLRISPGQAGARADTARRLGALPGTEAAAVDGTIGAAQAQMAATAARDLPGDAAAGLDQLVVESGPEVDPGRLRSAVDEYAHRTRPASLAAREERAWRARRLSVSRTG